MTTHEHRPVKVGVHPRRPQWRQPRYLWYPVFAIPKETNIGIPEFRNRAGTYQEPDSRGCLARPFRAADADRVYGVAGLVAPTVGSRWFSTVWISQREFKKLSSTGTDVIDRHVSSNSAYLIPVRQMKQLATYKFGPGYTSRLTLHQFVSNSVLHQLGIRRHSDLFKDAHAVGTNRFNADP